MIENRLEKVLRIIREKKELYTNNIVNGVPDNFEDYKYICGKIYGLSEAENFIRESLEHTVEERIYFS